MSPRRRRDKAEFTGEAEVPREIAQEFNDDRLTRIEAKLDGVATAVAGLSAQFTASSQRLDEHIERDEHLFHGNGKAGLITAVDRLTQWKKSIYWIVGAALTLGSAPSVADLVKSFLVTK
jgi:hypothetical protein